MVPAHPAAYPTEEERRRAAKGFLIGRGRVARSVWAVEVDRICYVNTTDEAVTAILSENAGRLTVAKVVKGWPIDGCE